ncbi:unnamed protein product [Diamesa hyperborea]
MAENDYDIYGDLDDALQPLSSVSNTLFLQIAISIMFLLFYCYQDKKEIPIPEPEEDKVSEVLIELQKENEKLKNENLLLTKNVSILLLTAKAEIERKDNQIKELRKEKDEIVFRKHKKNVHTSEKWSQTSSNFTRDNGSQTIVDKIDNRRTSRDSKDYNKRPRSNERRSNRDEKSRRRSRSRDKRKRSRSPSRSNRYDSGRNNDKRPRINYPSSTESRYSQPKSNGNDDIIKEEKPKVLGAYDDISPIKRQSGDASMHLFPTVPIELNVKSSKIAKPTETIVNGHNLKEAVTMKLNFDSTEVTIQPENNIKSKPLVVSPKKVVLAPNYSRIAEKIPTKPIDKLKSHLTTKESITINDVPSTPLSSQKTEIKQEPTGSKLIIPKQEPGIVPEQKLEVTTHNVVKLKHPVVVIHPLIAAVQSPQQVVKLPVAVKTPKVVVKSPISNVKSPVVAIKTEFPALPLVSSKSPVVIKTEPTPKITVSTLKSPIILKPALKENGIPTPVVPTEVIIKTEQISSPEKAEKVKIKIESTSPTVWENSNSTYRKEIVDGAEVIKIVRKPKVKKRKVVAN